MIRFKHLHPDVVETLQSPRDERIEFCRSDRWVGYTRATQILNELDQLLVYPKSLRMPNVLLVGRGGNGKSAIIQRLHSRHPVQMTDKGEPVAPLLFIQMPESPSLGEFWSTILWSLAVSHREKDPPHIKKRQAKSIMQYANVKILVIDEFHHLANAGKDAGELLAAIKGLSNELKISIVAAGTQAAIHALNSDPEMKSRFTPSALDRWKLDKEYLSFLASYEQLLSLAEPSQLASREIAPVLYGMAGDTIGGTVKLLKAAASHAIETGMERVTVKGLEQLNWTRPGDWDTVARQV